MGSGIMFWPGSGRVIFWLLGSCWVGSTFSSQENFHQKSYFSNFILSGQKKSPQVGSKNTQARAKLAPYLLGVRSILRSYCHGPSLVWEMEGSWIYEISWWRAHSIKKEPILKTWKESPMIQRVDLQRRCNRATPNQWAQYSTIYNAKTIFSNVNPKPKTADPTQPWSKIKSVWPGPITISDLFISYLGLYLF